ncbi:MAG: lipopolysaccharide transport periplasmic protein LptA [Alteromonadaceae bacterium]|nr:MAG: lipopolysaccharide transport periplasmic protein LptA [Alteromonadaceae bacterium]
MTLFKLTIQTPIMKTYTQNMLITLHHFAKGTLAIAILFLINTSAWALKTDSQQSVKINAGNTEFDIRTGTTTFSGEVIMQQGSMQISADTLITYGKLNNTTKIIATGRPARFTQIPAVDAAPVVAIANRIEYHVDKKTLSLIDNASLDQDGVSLSGKKIEYDVSRAIVKAGDNVKAGAQSDRIRMIIPAKTLQSQNKDKN